MGGRCIILNCIVGDRMRVSNVLVQRNQILSIHQNLSNDCYVLGTVFGPEHIKIRHARSSPNGSGNTPWRTCCSVVSDSFVTP